jgi:hypothetical protein
LNRLPKCDAFVVYTCYSHVVRVDVCKHLIAASVPFAIVNNRIANPSPSCFNNRASREFPFLHLP